MTGTGLRSDFDRVTARDATVAGAPPDTGSPGGGTNLADLAGADDVKAIEALAGTSGDLFKIGANSWALRTWQAPAAGITITNPAGVAGNPALVLANDLGALEALGSTGLAVRTGTDAWAQRTLQQPAAGLTITNPAGIAGDPTFALANDTAALEALSGTGYARRTGTDTWTLDASIPWASVSSTPTTLAGYGITDAQPLDADLTAIAALATAAGGRGLLTLAGTANRLAGFDGSGDASLVTMATGLALAAASLGLDVNALTEDTTPDPDADFFLSYDASASTHKKVKPANVYRSGSFTPTLSYATPGDLAVAYTIQSGSYVRIGNAVFFSLQVAGTPTFTTASGQVRIGGLPFTISATTAFYVQTTIASNVTWPTSATMGSAVTVAATTNLGLQGQGSGIALTSFTTTQYPSGSARDTRLTGFYFL